MKKIIILFVIVFSASTAFAVQNDSTIAPGDIRATVRISDESSCPDYFTKANALYDKADFQAALDIYAAIAGSGYISPELYYNMGNTYFRLNNLSSALLFYEKAAKLQPNDDDIVYNIAFVNGMITDRIEKKPELFVWEWLKTFRNMQSSAGWASTIVIFSWLTFAALAVYLVIRLIFWRKVSFIASLFFFTVTLVSVYFANAKYSDENSADTAIVFSPRVDIRHSPEENGKVYLTLHEGTKVVIEEELNGWYKIRLIDGRIGWIARESLRII